MQMDWQEIIAAVIVITVAVSMGLRWLRKRKHGGCDDCSGGSDQPNAQSSGQESKLHFLKKSR